MKTHFIYSYKSRPLKTLRELHLFVEECEKNYYALPVNSKRYIGIEDKSFIISPNKDGSITNDDLVSPDNRQSYKSLSLSVPLVPRPPCLQKSESKKKVDIETDIFTLSDIIKIVDANPLEKNCDYNIDLEALHNIKEELHDLNNMIGLKKLKQDIIDQLLYFIQKLHVSEEGDYMHTVLYGPPGTGKTEIAQILGKMYSKIGILKKNIFKKVTRNDLIAGYLGQTALKTKKVIDETLGGCLFIDEAYALANDFSQDSYSKECIDMLCESLSSNKKNWMVLIAGYKEDLHNSFFKANRGLKSRFIWSFHIEKYSIEDLVNIFIKKVDQQKWKIKVDNKEFVKWMEPKQKYFPNFGRDMEQLLSYTKICHGRRIYSKSKIEKKLITMDDIENGFLKLKENSLEYYSSPPMGLYV